ncbi:MAG: hypothetical protein QM723_20445 [Myxococcaceae bacterium]
MAPWLLVVLTATPQLDLVLTRRVETTAERAEDVVQRVHDALEAEGLHPADPAATRKRLNTDPTVCAGKRPCEARLGLDLGSTVLVTVDVGHLADRMAVALEAIDPKSGKKLASRAFAMSSLGYPAGVETELKPFAHEVAQLEQLKGTSAGTAATPGDAPFQSTQPGLIPPPPPPPPLEVEQGKPTRWGLISSGVLTVATAVTAIVFLSLALVNQNQLSSNHTVFMGMTANKLTHDQALDYASDANTDYTVALGTGIGAAALAVLTVFLWRAD